MKLTNIVSILFTFLCFNISTFSQHSIGFYGTMNYGSLFPDVNEVDLNPDWGGGFGVCYYKELNSDLKIVTQTGLEIIQWQSDQYDELIPERKSYWRRSSLNFYVGANYNFVNNPHFTFGITLLSRLGYIYNQVFLAGINPQNPTFSLFLTKESNLLLGIDSKIDVQLDISDKLTFLFRPGISATYFDIEDNLHGQLLIDFGLLRSI